MKQILWSPYDLLTSSILFAFLTKQTIGVIAPEFNNIILNNWWVKSYKILLHVRIHTTWVLTVQERMKCVLREKKKDYSEPCCCLFVAVSYLTHLSTLFIKAKWFSRLTKLETWFPQTYDLFYVTQHWRLIKQICLFYNFIVFFNLQIQCSMKNNWLMTNILLEQYVTWISISWNKFFNEQLFNVLRIQS